MRWVIYFNCIKKGNYNFFKCKKELVDTKLNEFNLNYINVIK